MHVHRRNALPALLAAALVAGCGHASAPAVRQPNSPLALRVLGDSAATLRLPAARLPSPPSTRMARLTLVRISPSRAAVQAPLPAAEADDPPPAGGTSAAAGADATLHPPILREPATLQLAGEHQGWVELDVQVGADGSVTAAELVSTTADSATVAAALTTAERLRFFPATLRGRPVAVWCRQRLEVGR